MSVGEKNAQQSSSSEMIVLPQTIVTSTVMAYSSRNSNAWHTSAPETPARSTASL